MAALAHRLATAPPTPCLPSPPLFPPLPRLAGPHSLVLDLEVEVPAEPVVEEGLLHIAGGGQLQRGQRISDWGWEENQRTKTYLIKVTLPRVSGLPL